MGASWGVLGASWGVLGRLEDVLGASLDRFGASSMCLWGVVGRVVVIYKLYYKTAVKTQMMRQRSSWNRLEIDINHLKFIENMLKSSVSS